MPKTLTASKLGNFLNGIVDTVDRPNVPDAMQASLATVKADLTVGFLAGHAPDGSKWLPLKYPRPKGHNQENKPLIDTGKLMNSVAYQGADHIEGVTGEGLTVGTNVEYGTIHQDGTNKIPKREFMGFSDKVLDTSAELTADSVINQIDNL